MIPRQSKHAVVRNLHYAVLSFNPDYIDANLGHSAREMRRNLAILDAVLDVGPLGAFDDSGVTTSCLVTAGSDRFLYYTGWNRGARFSPAGTSWDATIICSSMPT